MIHKDSDMKSARAKSRLLLSCALTVYAALPGLQYRALGQSPAEGADAAKSKLVASYGKLPMTFEANRGQANPQVRFLTRGAGYSLFLTDAEAVFAFSGAKPPSARFNSPIRQPAIRSVQSRETSAQSPGIQPDPTAKPSVLRMQLAGARAGVAVSGEDALPGTARCPIHRALRDGWETTNPSKLRPGTSLSLTAY